MTTSVDGHHPNQSMGSFFVCDFITFSNYLSGLVSHVKYLEVYLHYFLMTILARFASFVIFSFWKENCITTSSYIKESVFVLNDDTVIKKCQCGFFVFLFAFVNKAKLLNHGKQNIEEGRNARGFVVWCSLKSLFVLFLCFPFVTQCCFIHPSKQKL